VPFDEERLAAQGAAQLHLEGLLDAFRVINVLFTARKLSSLVSDFEVL